MRNRLSDSAQFWVGFSGVLGVAGGVLVTVGLARTAQGASLFSSGWFDAGLGSVALSILALHWALILFLAHGQAEKQMCPDPTAHDGDDELKAMVQLLRDEVSELRRKRWLKLPV